jgi:hypothetical protein
MLARYPPPGVDAVAPRSFGTAVAYATGRPNAFFNAVLLLESVDLGDVAAAVAWLRGQGIEPSLRVRDDLDGQALASAAAGFGLQRAPWSEPAMVLQPLSPAPSPPPGLEIIAATPDGLDRFYRANAAAFGFPMEQAEAMQAFTPPAFVEDPRGRSSRPAAPGVAQPRRFRRARWASRVYRAMGFEAVARYVAYLPPPAASPDHGPKAPAGLVHRAA